MSRHIIEIEDEEEFCSLNEKALEQEEYVYGLSSKLDKCEDILLILILHRGEIRLVSLAAQGKKTGETNARHKLHFFKFILLSNALPLSLIQEKAPKEFISLEKSIIKSSKKRGAAPLSESLLASIIIMLRDRESEDKIQEIADLVSEITSSKRYNVQDFIRQETDAVQLALGISGCDRELENQRKTFRFQLPESFFKMISKYRIEDNLIAHDDYSSRVSRQFLEWSQDSSSQGGIYVFHDIENPLLTFNVNRTPIEKVTGVDLLYYNAPFQSFILIQYKKMQKEDGKYMYRPDKQFNKDVERMRKTIEYVGNVQAQITEERSIDTYRLGDAFTFFKFCKDTDLHFGPLIRGMYCPLDLVELHLASQQCRGPRGGRRIIEGEFDRYFNNTDFIAMAKNGWIGSKMLDMNDFSTMVEDLLKQGKSLTFAEKLA